MVNATDDTITVVIQTRKGTTIQREMGVGAWLGERREPGREGVRYQRVEAFAGSGKKIGEFDIKDLPNQRGAFGEFLTLVIYSDGIYPLATRFQGFKYAGHAEEDFYANLRMYQDDVVGFYEQERARQRKPER